jgi:hypothetical protein
LAAGLLTNRQKCWKTAGSEHPKMRSLGSFASSG